MNFHVINIHSFKFIFRGKHILFPNNNFRKKIYFVIMSNKTDE